MFQLRGRVVSGHRRGGSQLGFPTANIELSASVIRDLTPYLNGVFYGWGLVEAASVSDTAHPDATTAFDVPLPIMFSVGFNPHFKDTALTVEVYFDHKFSKDFYGSCVRVLCLGKLREQKAYTTLDNLMADIRNDVSEGAKRLASTEGQEWRRDPYLSVSASPLTDVPVPSFALASPSKL